MQVLEYNHAEFMSTDGEAGTDSLSMGISEYVNGEISTEEFWGILQENLPVDRSPLSVWEGGESYGIHQEETHGFDGDGGDEGPTVYLALLFSTDEGYFVEYFKKK